jgi:hypothetical protein
MADEPILANEPIAVEWKAIPDFPRYEASKAGFIRNAATQKQLKGHLDPAGYIYVSLINANGKKKYYVHRLILQTFVGPLEKGKYCDHINGVRNCNELSNLRIVTAAQNNENKRKPATAKLKAILQLDLKTGGVVKHHESIKAASIEFNDKTKRSIVKVLSGKALSAYNFGWKYFEIEDLEGEIWKEYTDPKTNNKFLASNKGRIKNNGMLYGSKNEKGYMMLNHTRIHRIIAGLFIPNPDNLPIISHIDNNKSNNCVENLCWSTVQKNTQSAYDDNLFKPVRQVLEFDITGNIIEKFTNSKRVSEKTKLTRNHINDRCRKLELNKPVFSKDGRFFKYLSDKDDVVGKKIDAEVLKVITEKIKKD